MHQIFFHSKKKIFKTLNQMSAKNGRVGASKNYFLHKSNDKIGQKNVRIKKNVRINFSQLWKLPKGL